MNEAARKTAKKVSTKTTDSVAAFTAAARRLSEERYELVLFIAGTTPLSTAALSNVVEVCERYLEGRVDLVVVDVYQEPARARAEQIIAVPTLLKKAPLPMRRMIGDLSDREAVLRGLDLVPSSKTEKVAKRAKKRVRRGR